jgi:hypothetical protein
MGPSYRIVLTLGLSGNISFNTFHHLFVGLYGWKGIKLFLKMGLHAHVLQHTKLWASSTLGRKHTPKRKKIHHIKRVMI